MTWWNLYSRCFKYRLSNYLNSFISHEMWTVAFLLFYKIFLLMVNYYAIIQTTFLGEGCSGYSCLFCTFLAYTWRLFFFYSLTVLILHFLSLSSDEKADEVNLLFFVNSFPNVFGAVGCLFLIYKRNLRSWLSSVSHMWEFLFS